MPCTGGCKGPPRATTPSTKMRESLPQARGQACAKLIEDDDTPLPDDCKLFLTHSNPACRLRSAGENGEAIGSTQCASGASKQGWFAHVGEKPECVVHAPRALLNKVEEWEREQDAHFANQPRWVGEHCAKALKTARASIQCAYSPSRERCAMTYASMTTACDGLEIPCPQCNTTGAIQGMARMRDEV
jgi:hypothetical protein